MRVAGWSSVAVAVLFLAGCGQTRERTHSGTLKTYSGTLNLSPKKLSNNRVFTVKRHTAIVVTLTSNRSAGYYWQFVPGSSPTEPLRLLSHRYLAGKQSVPGAAGKEIWRFRAVSKGALPIGFVYRGSVHPSELGRFVGATIAVS